MDFKELWIEEYDRLIEEGIPEDIAQWQAMDAATDRYSSYIDYIRDKNEH